MAYRAADTAVCDAPKPAAVGEAHGGNFPQVPRSNVATRLENGGAIMRACVLTVLAAISVICWSDEREKRDFLGIIPDPVLNSMRRRWTRSTPM